MHWPLQLLEHSTSSLEWPRHCVPLNAGAGFVHFLDRVLNPPQVLEHPVYGVHSDQLPCTGSGSAKERDLSLSIRLPWLWRWWGRGGGYGWVRREKIWNLRFFLGGGAEREQSCFPLALSSFCISLRPTPNHPQPPPKQLRRHTHAFYSLRLMRVKFVYSWFNKVCFGHWEAIVWRSLQTKSLHCSICPMPNYQWQSITKATFFYLAVTKTYEMGAEIQVKASSWDVIYTVL